MTPATPQRVGLVLSGGGARAAYQVGVIKGISEVLGHPRHNPYPIITGTSAGAINAVVLASYASRAQTGINRLEAVWSGFTSDRIFRSDFGGLSKNALKWLSGVLFPRRHHMQALSLLDNQPLRKLLTSVIHFDNIAASIRRGDLDAVCATAYNYSSGDSVSFFQGNEQVESWERFRRRGRRVSLDLSHLMASAAIPMLFPAEKVSAQYFGDGSMGFLAPNSPAIHLGADKLLIISVDPVSEPANQCLISTQPPNPAEIGGHLLDTIFIDALQADLERLRRINKTVSKFPVSRIRKNNVGLKHIETLVIAPLQDSGPIALRYIDELPRLVRLFFKRLGLDEESDGTVLSYLLFEKPFMCELIKMGFRDALAKRDHITAFFGDQSSSG